MKLKKLAKILLSCVVAGALFTGCGGGGNKPAENPSAEVKLGMITHLNANEKTMNEIYKQIHEKAKLKFSDYAVTYYDSLTLLQMGIESGGVDEISVYDSVADYLVANNDKYEVSEDKPLNVADSFCFAVRKDDKQLLADLDKVIGEMKADGSLDKLIGDYITNVDKKNPPEVEIPKIDGAETIKFGVTGDLPPLDFVSADGKPAGFNTAVLAEISKRLKKNIEIIDIDGGARATALTSKQIDVVFWAILPVDDLRPAYIDKSDDIEFSTPYFRDNITHLKLKK